MDERYLEKLPRFSWAEFKKHVDAGTPFEAISPIATTLIRVKRYDPCIALAVHAGHRLREESLSKMTIEETERLQDEDVATEHMIQDFPIQLVGLDSRYEYDLNRRRDQSVYLKPFQSWGKKVWLHPPSKEELDISYQKYDEFYEMLDCVAEQMTARFGKFLVFDVHSYNFRRQQYVGREQALPTFNIAASAADQKKHRAVLDQIAQNLAKVRLTNADSKVKENDIFKKDGAVVAALEKKCPDALTVPIEIKKIYTDERTGDVNRAMIEVLRRGIFSAATEAAALMGLPLNP
ncbi:MAG: N-formylglutamate amidohydrolase [Pseudomonadota bacterium]